MGRRSASRKKRILITTINTMFLQQPHAKGVRLLSCYNDILVLFLCFFKNNVYFCSMRIIKRQTLVEYYTQVLIRFVGTHKEYDKIKDISSI